MGICEAGAAGGPRVQVGVALSAAGAVAVARVVGDVVVTVPTGHGLEGV